MHNLDELTEIQISARDYVTAYISHYLKFMDKDCIPISFKEWANLFYALEYPPIKCDVIGNFHVTTKWMGFSLNDSGIFETKVCRVSENSSEYMDSEYYQNQNEAMEGHQIMVDFCQMIKEEEDKDYN